MYDVRHTRCMYIGYVWSTLYVQLRRMTQAITEALITSIRRSTFDHSVLSPVTLYHTKTHPRLPSGCNIILNDPWWFWKMIAGCRKLIRAYRWVFDKVTSNRTPTETIMKRGRCIHRTTMDREDCPHSSCAVWVHFVVGYC